MSRFSHHKEKYRIKSELSLVHHNEGTSARTRPFSFEDIMLRRKNKKAGEIQAAPGDADTREYNIETATDGLETDRDINRQSFLEGSRRLSKDLGRVSSRRKEHNIHGVPERKLAKDASGERRNLETKSNSSLTKDLSRNDTVRGKSARHVDNRKRSNRSNEDSRDETGQNRLGDLSRREISRDKANGRSVKEREHNQGTDNDHKRGYSRRRDVDQSRHEHKNEPNKRHLRASARIDKFVDTARGAVDKESESKHRNEGKEKIRDPDVNKHHMHKSSQLSEKNEKESSTIHHEELRLKRKMSGSREHDKDRSRRSSSFSPRAHKRMSLGDQFYTSKEKFQKPHTDTERKKISSNGSSGSQRRYFESSSGLGGYSPRKRITEAAANTPSPPTRSPGRRSAGWDHPATRKDSNINSSLVSDVQLSIQTATENDPKTSSIIPDISAALKPGVISQYAPSSQIHAIDSIQLTQATRPMRRLYVENLPSLASEKAVLECVNSFLLSSGVNHIKGTLPCISCMINKEKNQALLEFLTPEDASAALSMDGRFFSGSLLKIRRPKDFVEPTTGVRDKSVDETHSISEKVEDSSHRIFIGGISKLISSETLMKIAGTFGSLKAFHFEHNKDTDVHYAFLEYVDHLVTQKACAGLNGMKLGGQVLTVVQATADAPSLVENSDRTPFYGIPEHAIPLLKSPTRVLKLKNVLDLEGISLLSEAELEEILEDVKLECGRFGSVKAANVVRHINDSISGETFVSVVCSGSDMNHKHESDEVRQESNTQELAKSDTSKPPNCITEDVKVEETEKGDAISDGNPSISNKTVCSIREPDDTGKTTTVSNSLSCEKLVRNVLEDENHEATLDRDPTKTTAACREILDITSGECTNELDMSTVELVSNDDASDVSPVKASEMQSKAADVEGSVSEEDVGKSSPSELDASYGSEAKKEGIENIGDCFEVGCVVVEFKREEASRMAAHCLHGRLFDGRIVTVEYVDPDLYHKRFPKQV